MSGNFRRGGGEEVGGLEWSKEQKRGNTEPPPICPSPPPYIKYLFFSFLLPGLFYWDILAPFQDCQCTYTKKEKEKRSKKERNKEIIICI